jgi:amino-acid N-acetyltransferase
LKTSKGYANQEMLKTIENTMVKERHSGANPDALVRKARLTDVPSIHRLINHYADRQLMLPKTLLQLYENIRDYSVAVSEAGDGAVMACGALHIYWQNLAEIRAVAVVPETAAKGVGSVLVEGLIDEARAYRLEQVFVFTYVPKFFSRFGFIQVEHGTMPLKVYNECFHCPKFNTCDELAMVLPL